MDVVGLDIGGSSTVAVRARGGASIVSATGGSASLESVSRDTAAAVLAGLAEALGRDGVSGVYAGAAGANGPREQEALAALVRAAFPGARVVVAHDTELLLPAAGLDVGIAVIAGTGSVAVGVGPDGRRARAGGWGHLLGDEGSGGGIAREAMRHTLGRADAGQPPDELSLLVLAHAGVDTPGELVGVVYARPDRRHWANLGGPVVAAADVGDPPAARIVDEGAAAIAGLVRSVAARVGPPVPVVLYGGLHTHLPSYAARVTARVRAAGLDDVRVADTAPVTGALALARTLG